MRRSSRPAPCGGRRRIRHERYEQRTRERRQAPVQQLHLNRPCPRGTQRPAVHPGRDMPPGAHPRGVRRRRLARRRHPDRPGRHGRRPGRHGRGGDRGLRVRSYLGADRPGPGEAEHGRHHPPVREQLAAAIDRAERGENPVDYSTGPWSRRICNTESYAPRLDQAAAMDGASGGASRTRWLLRPGRSGRRAEPLARRGAGPFLGRSRTTSHLPIGRLRPPEPPSGHREFRILHGSSSQAR